MLLMEHNQNQQKLEFLWNTKDWPCTCFPVVDHSPTAVMIPMTLHDGHHTFFVEETDQKTWILTVNIGLKHPKKGWFHRTRWGIWGWPTKLLPYMLPSSFLTQSSSFPKKNSRSLPPPIFHHSFPWFSYDFSPFHQWFSNGFPTSVPGVVENEAGFEKRPTLQLGMSLASGTQLHRHEAF